MSASTRPVSPPSVPVAGRRPSSLGPLGWGVLALVAGRALSAQASPKRRPRTPAGEPPLAAALLVDLRQAASGGATAAIANGARAGVSTGTRATTGASRVSPPPAGDRSQATVVVTTHNDGGNIAVLLARLAAEAEVGEILVVASGCDDDTIPLAMEASASEAADGRIRLYVEADRSGKAAAMNFGLAEATLPVVVMVCGDVLPASGAISRLLDGLEAPGVGMVGGRPVPLNDDRDFMGHAVHLLWRLHHRLALGQPKLGEMVALRSEVVGAMPPTAVDEACLQALVEDAGWACAYVPDAVVLNRGPATVAEFVHQRRRIHAGHLWLRHRHGYAVPSLKLHRVARELLGDVVADPRRARPSRLAWTAGTVLIEAWARCTARCDYVQGKEQHVWDMVQGTKAPGAGPHGGHSGDLEQLEALGLATTAAP